MDMLIPSRTARRWRNVGMLVALVAGSLLFPARPSAQVAPGDARYDRCQQLLKKEVRRLTDDELTLLAECLRPAHRRQAEREAPPRELPRIQRSAPIRIYGK